MLKELRKRAKEAVAKRVEKRVERYKNKLKQQLPSQISLWSAREDRLLKIISKKLEFQLLLSLSGSVLTPLAKSIPIQMMKQKPKTKILRLVTLQTTTMTPRYEHGLHPTKVILVCLSVCVLVCLSHFTPPVPPPH